MLASTSSQVLRQASNLLRNGAQRNLATSYVLANKVAVDPIQGLFVEKIREYATKKKAAGGKFVDASPETEAFLQSELDKKSAAYGGGKGVDMSKFPDFKWADPAVENPEI